MDRANLCKMTKANLEKKTCNKIILHRQNYIMEDPRPASPLSVMGTHSHNYIWIIEYLIEMKFLCPPLTHPAHHSEILQIFSFKVRNIFDDKVRMIFNHG